MKLKLSTLAPATIVAGVIGVICLLVVAEERFGAFGMLRRLEWITFDWRARQAAQHPLPASTNLGLVFISDESIDALKNGTLDFRAGLYWPRHVYGRLIAELGAQGARVIGFDVLFADLRPDQGTNDVPGALTSDNFFAGELSRAGNIVLAADKGVVPPELFRTNAWAVGDISSKKDTDGVLRRARPFETYYLWDKLIRRASERYGFDLRQPHFESRRLSFPIAGGTQERAFELNENGDFDWVRLYEEMAGEKIGGLVRPYRKPYREMRVWDMGLTIGARHLGLDLAKAVVKPGRIILKGPGIKRVIPTDNEGRFSFDWSITAFDQRLTRESIESLLLQAQNRLGGDSALLTNRWKDKLVFVGSIASAGNDLTDLGATSLEKEAFLTSRFWNTANSLITGNFIQPTPLVVVIILIIVSSLLAGVVTELWRPAWAVLAVLGTGSFYVFLARHLYVSDRIWLPIITPISGLLLAHFGLIAHRAFSEQNERRRIREVFAKIVSPSVVNELLKAENLSVVGARRKVTISFADVRGFTQLTDSKQARAEEYVRHHRVVDQEAESYFDSQSRDLLRTINLYLGLMADIVKKHDGTLDKYIGDCVMAFWGAPAPNEKHALACVRAAIESQQAIHALNLQRAAENIVRAEQNADRVLRGEHPLPLLDLLAVGTGINTGIVTVGLMGSDAHVYNYTVFGRDVNVASRVEGCSGGGRIIMGEATYFELLHDDLELAKTCIELEPVVVRGISNPIKIFEVPWQPAGSDGRAQNFDLEAEALMPVMTDHESVLKS